MNTISLYEGYKVKNDPPVLALHSCDTKQLNASLMIQFLYVTWLVDLRVLVLFYMEVFQQISPEYTLFLVNPTSCIFGIFFIRVKDMSVGILNSVLLSRNRVLAMLCVLVDRLKGCQH